jgi:AraC-like DNA-binding protein
MLNDYFYYMSDRIKIVGEKAGEIPLSPALPSLSDPGNIPGVKSLGANGPFGYLLLQEIAGNGYSIRYHSYFLNQDDTLTLTGEKPVLRLLLALKHSFYYSTKGLDENVLHERGFNISYVPFMHQTLRLRAKRRYVCVEIHFPIDHLRQLAQFFPDVENFLQKIENQQPALLNRFNQVADKEIMSVVDDMLYYAYPPEIRKKYLGSKVMEILILTLGKIDLHSLDSPVDLPEKVVEKIYETRELLVGNLKRDYTLHELGALVGLSIYKLKKGFRVIYDLSLSDFLHEARMQKARLLLEETDLPISRIATDTGYSHPFAFSAAFKKYFGYAPSVVQRSRKQTAHYIL